MGDVGRREFLRRTGAAALGGVLAGRLAGAEAGVAAASAPGPAAGGLPTRRLGRLGLQMPVLGLGCAPMGHALYEPGPFAEVVNAAIDAGVRYLDVARIYDVAEERLAPVLAKRRSEVFLVTKSWAQSRDEVLRSLETSLSKLGVTSVDLCHLHNVGTYAREALAPAGALAGLREAKAQGLIRHIGCTGHSDLANFAPVIETGEIDLVMTVINFVDAHTYRFEEQILPLARKHDCAVAAMKVYGGVPNVWGGYRDRESGRLAGDEHRQDAIDYALSVPGVSLCVVGLKTLDELRQALAAVRGHRPLEGQRRERVLAKGRELAAQWGARFGSP